MERDVARSSAAIEYKFNNVSAVLDEMGAVWIPGYKPLRNVQERLRLLVQEQFEADGDLRSCMLKAVADAMSRPPPSVPRWSPPAVAWPERSATRVGVTDINFAAIESSNRALGRAGEVTVVDAERTRLSAAGREISPPKCGTCQSWKAMAWATTSNHSVGSIDEPVYIEVKTTRYGKEVPFYISQNEVEASSDLGRVSAAAVVQIRQA